MRLPASVVVAVVVVAVAQQAAATPPRGIRLSWTESDTTGRMSVTWNTGFSDETHVRYGLDTTYGMVEDGTAEEAAGDLGWIHEVALTDLNPNTVYHYRVGGPGGWSDDLTFRTAPEPDGCTPFTFVALGDNRSDDNRGPSPKWSPILGEALLEDPAFVLNTGDLVMDGQSADQWDQFIEDTGPHTALVPLLATIGNHDDDRVTGDDALYNTVFALPRNDVTDTEDFYYFTYGDAIFVSLSTSTFEGGDTAYAMQAEWLDRVLTDNPRTWKIVFFHHPPYTGTTSLLGFDLNHPSNEKGQNPALIPIFDKHHVDIVFNGHNHFYQRFSPMRYDSHDAQVGVAVSDFANGTVYAVTGGAGALTYNLVEPYMFWLCADTPGSEVCTGRHHYVRVDIDGNTLTYTAVATAEQLLGYDENNIDVIDSFTIVKVGQEPVCAPDVADPGPDADVGGGVADVVSSADVGGAGADVIDTSGLPADDISSTSSPDSDSAIASDLSESPGEDSVIGDDVVKPQAESDAAAGQPSPAGGDLVPALDALSTPAGAPSASGSSGCSAGDRARSPWAALSLISLLLGLWWVARRAALPSPELR